MVGRIASHRIAAEYPAVRCSGCQKMLSPDGQGWVSQGYQVSRRSFDGTPIRGVMARPPSKPRTVYCRACADQKVEEAKQKMRGESSRTGTHRYDYQTGSQVLRQSSIVRSGSKHGSVLHAGRRFAKVLWEDGVISMVKPKTATPTPREVAIFFTNSYQTRLRNAIENYINACQVLRDGSAGLNSTMYMNRRDNAQYIIEHESDLNLQRIRDRAGLNTWASSKQASALWDRAQALPEWDSIWDDAKAQYGDDIDQVVDEVAYRLAEALGIEQDTPEWDELYENVFNGLT